MTAQLVTGAQTAAPRVERALYERAVGYTFDKEELKVVNGEIRRVRVTEHVPPEFNSMRFWLANRQKKRWKDLAHLELGVDEANPIWFKQFEGTAMRPQPRELPEPEPIEADYEDVTGQPADAPPPRPCALLSVLLLQVARCERVR